MKMSTVTLALASAALLAGCATKDYVNEQISAANTRMDGQQADNSAARRELEKRITAKQDEMQAEIKGASATAKEALERANAAGKLAEGKFVFETSISGQVAFEFESSKLTPDMMTKLDEFAAGLKSDNKNVYVEIQGHTDSSGSDSTNMKFGQERADAVRNYLAVKGGIALHRMNAISYGETAPIADNKTRAGRTENRRVTLVVLQ